MVIMLLYVLFPYCTPIDVSKRKWQDDPTARKLVFNICPIQQIMTTQPYVDHNAYNNAWCDPLRCIWLPQYNEAKILLDKFVQDIDRVHHVVHTPALPKLLDDIYNCLNGQGKLQAGSVLLLLSIIASATHCWVRLFPRLFVQAVFSSTMEFCSPF
jgi:hypothetical protein